MSDPGAVHQIPTGEKAESDFLEQLHQILVGSNFLWSAPLLAGVCGQKGSWKPRAWNGCTCAANILRSTREGPKTHQRSTRSEMGKHLVRSGKLSHLTFAM